MNIFFTSDSHFFHAKILTFKDNDGNLIRPEFSCVDEMNERMIQCWNDVVKHNDCVYHLGDVMMTASTPEIQKIMHRLNGSKRLILGNHDTQALKTMMPFFKKIQLWRLFKDEGFICTHVPLMPSQFRQKVQYNVHGHLHQNLMRDNEGVPIPTYINVCVEHTNYTPVHMDQILEEIKKRNEAMGI